MSVVNKRSTGITVRSWTPMMTKATPRWASHLNPQPGLRVKTCNNSCLSLMSIACTLTHNNCYGAKYPISLQNANWRVSSCVYAYLDNFYPRLHILCLVFKFKNQVNMSNDSRCRRLQRETSSGRRWLEGTRLSTGRCAISHRRLAISRARRDYRLVRTPQRPLKHNLLNRSHLLTEYVVLAEKC